MLYCVNLKNNNNNKNKTWLIRMISQWPLETLVQFFFLSFFNFAFFVVRDKVEINKYAKIDKDNNQPSWWNKLGQYKELLHGQRRFQVGKIRRAHLSCSNSQWEHSICLNHLASHIHCNSQQNKLCLWWIVTILHTLDLSKSLCFKRFFSYKKRKNKTKSTIN